MYQGSSTGWAQISHPIVHLMDRLTINMYMYKYYMYVCFTIIIVVCACTCIHVRYNYWHYSKISGHVHVYMCAIIIGIIPKSL